MVDDIRSALVDILNDVSWMDEETRTLAKEKVIISTFLFKIYIISV